MSNITRKFKKFEVSVQKTPDSVPVVTVTSVDLSQISSFTGVVGEEKTTIIVDGKEMIIDMDVVTLEKLLRSLSLATFT